jgi:hypothetical protein
MELLSTQQKEKSDLILEPFQVMVQLALVGFCPIGTKISISNNILTLQKPTLFQGAVRWWQSDNKDDLYYLFHAIRRYMKWYKDPNNKITAFILTLAKKGLTRLIETYAQSDKKSITQTLSLYKNVLDLEKEDIFKENNANTINMDNVFENIKILYTDNIYRLVYNALVIIEEEEFEDYRQEYIYGLETILNPINYKIKKWVHENLTC